MTTNLSTAALLVCAIGVIPIVRADGETVDNVIVLVADGCGAAHTTLTRWYLQADAAASAGAGALTPSTEKRGLAVDAMQVGCVRTYASNSIITDSAPAASAFATGFKTTDGFISVLPDVVTIPGVAACDARTRYRPVATVLEGAQRAGKGTGLVATCTVQHATPAAYSAHVPDRSLYEEIGEQQVYLDIDVVFGGGRQYLVPADKGGKRGDGQDLVEVLKGRGYRVVTTNAELADLDREVRKVWGLFAADALAYDFDRERCAPTEPSLEEMTEAAIGILSHHERGFFLMVEGSKVDWASHANDPIGVLSEALAFDRAVAAALRFARKNGRTMVMVFADHGNGGMSIGSKATNSTYSELSWQSVIGPLSKATLTGDGVEMALIALARDADGLTEREVLDAMERYYGIPKPATPSPAIAPLDALELAAIRSRVQELVMNGLAGGLNSVIGPMISRRAGIGWTTNGHTGEDLFIYTYGAPRGLGTIENTDIARISAEVMGIDLAAVSDLLYVPALDAFAALGATAELNGVEIARLFSGDRTRKVRQLVPADLVVTKGPVILVLPVGTDRATITKQLPDGQTSVLQRTMDGRTLYTAPYKAGSAPNDPAPPLDAAKVYVPREAIDLLRTEAP
jgi:alkaline phosphatase